MIHYHAGYNMPGYLPESEDASYAFATFAEARNSLLEDMEQHEDSLESWVEEHDCDDIPCPTYGDWCAYMMAGQVRSAAEDLDATLPSSSEWGGYGGGLAYWIVQCGETICLDDEDVWETFQYVRDARRFARRFGALQIQHLT